MGWLAAWLALFDEAPLLSLFQVVGIGNEKRACCADSARYLSATLRSAHRMGHGRYERAASMLDVSYLSSEIAASAGGAREVRGARPAMLYLKIAGGLGGLLIGIGILLAFILGVGETGGALMVAGVSVLSVGIAIVLLAFAWAGWCLPPE